MQSCSWFWTESTDRSDRFISKSSKLGIPNKQELDDKLEGQTGAKFAQNYRAPLKRERHKMEKKIQEGICECKESFIAIITCSWAHLCEYWRTEMRCPKSHWRFMGWVGLLTKDRKSKKENKLFEVLKIGLQAITEELLHQFIERMPRQHKATIKSKVVPSKYWMVHTVGVYPNCCCCCSSL